MVFGEIYPAATDADWKFRAVGQGYASGLAGIAQGLRRRHLMSVVGRGGRGSPVGARGCGLMVCSGG